jgi:hypothetical protein
VGVQILTERSQEVVENKALLFFIFVESQEVIENKGTYARKAKRLLMGSDLDAI